MEETHVADEDGVGPLAPATSVIGKVVRGHGGSGCAVLRRATEPTRTNTEGSSAVAAEATTPPTEASSANTSEPSAEPSGTTSARESAAGSAHTKTSATSASAGKAILPHFQLTVLPFVSIELGDSVTRIFGGFESNNTAAFGAAIGADVNIGTDNSTCRKCQTRPTTRRAVCCPLEKLTGLTEEILEILPTDSVGKLQCVSKSSRSLKTAERKDSRWRRRSDGLRHLRPCLRPCLHRGEGSRHRSRVHRPEHHKARGW